MGPIELLIYHVDDLKINKSKGSISEIENIISESKKSNSF